MLQKIVLIAAIFIIVLIALTFGERISTELFSWISYLSGKVIHNFGDLYDAIWNYVANHPSKIILALLITIPLSIWILRNKSREVEKPSNQRKIAIVLAVCLGWLGGHCFYLGQIGKGIVYLILFYVYTPLAVVLALIDAVRYLFMNDDEFLARRL